MIVIHNIVPIMKLTIASGTPLNTIQMVFNTIDGIVHLYLTSLPNGAYVKRANLKPHIEILIKYKKDSEEKINDRMM